MTKTSKTQSTKALPQDERYWKPKTSLWFWAAEASFIAGVLINFYIPDEVTINPHSYRILLGGAIVLLLVFYIVSKQNTAFANKFYHRLEFIFAIGVFMAVWDILTTKTSFLPLPYFPGLAQIIGIMVEDRALLLLSAGHSFLLFSLGMVLGTFFGLLSGIATGWSRQWDYWLSPIIRVSGIIPAIVWLPIALVLFPTSFTAGVFLIVIASWFPVTSMTASGIISTPKTYFEIAKTLGASKKFQLFRIAVPYAMPNIFIGILTAVAFSFVTLIVSEMVGAKAGLGYYINWAKGWGAYDKMYAAIIIIAAEFSLILALVGAIRSYVLRWQRGILK